MQALKLSNTQLLDRLVHQDIAALSELYERHASVVLGWILKIVQDRSHAEQLLEETFFALWQAPKSVDGALRTWLLHQACQQCIGAGVAITDIRALIIAQPLLT